MNSMPDKVALFQVLSNGTVGYLGKGTSTLCGSKSDTRYYTADPAEVANNPKAILLNWKEVEAGMLWHCPNSKLYATPRVERGEGESFGEWMQRLESFNAEIAKVIVDSRLS